MSFYYSSDSTGLKSHLLASNILGTCGSSTEFNCLIHISKSAKDLSDVISKVKNIPSAPLKKLDTTFLNRS
jgi:hypothetical protein